jgi:hypothetical protein
LHLNVAALEAGSPVAYGEKVDLMYAHLHSANGKVTLPVQPLLYDFFG